MTGKLILVGGGARSGKSAFALGYAQQLGRRRAFVATAQAHDQEMADRIAQHQLERGATFITIEEPIQLEKSIVWAQEVEQADVLLVDCLTLWLSNLLLRGDPPEAIDQAVESLTRAVTQPRKHILLVTNEVGMGIVPESPLGRAFRDLAGRAHQRLAAAADEVYFGAVGMMLRLRPSPVTAYAIGELP